MGKIILYHGTQNKIMTPVFGGGNDKHDYGRGFYLAEVLNLARSGRFVYRIARMDGYINMN